MTKGEDALTAGGLVGLEASTENTDQSLVMSRRQFMLGLGIGVLGVAQIGALLAKSREAACGEDAAIDCYLQAAGLEIQESVQPTLAPAGIDQAAAVETVPETLPNNNSEVETLPDLGIPWLPPTVRYWGNEIQSAAAAYQVDPQLISIIITLESGGWPQAISPAEAQGLMQIWPPTGRSLAAELGMAEGQYSLLEPVTNTTFGALKLRQLLNSYQPPGEITLSDYTIQMVSMGYNGGEGRVNNHLAGLPIPRETQIYSSYAVEMWQQRAQPSSLAFERWKSPDFGNGNYLISKAQEFFAAQGIFFE